MITPSSKELIRKIRELEAGHAHLREDMSRLVASGRALEGPPRPENKSVVRRGRDLEDLLERRYINILQSMGQAIYVYDDHRRVIYWNQHAEKLFGYTTEEALGNDILSMLVNPDHYGVAFDIIDRVRKGESWTGQFPVELKMGKKLLVIVSLDPFYDDDGTLVGLVAVSVDSKPFLEIQYSLSKTTEVESGPIFRRSRNVVTSKLGLNPEQPLQTAISSKLTNLAKKVSSKVRSKIKADDGVLYTTDHKDDGNPVEASTHKRDPVCSAFGVFCKGAETQRESSDEGEGKIALHNITSKAEAWIQKKTKQWLWKGNDQPAPKDGTRQFGWPWSNDEQDLNRRTHSAARLQTGQVVWSSAIEESGSRSSFNASSSSSAIGGSIRSCNLSKFDIQSNSSDYEILWEDLIIGDEVGQGSCGTVYHGLWDGSDVAIKVFSRIKYSEDAIQSFKRERTFSFVVGVRIQDLFAPEAEE